MVPVPSKVHAFVSMLGFQAHRLGIGRQEGHKVGHSGIHERKLLNKVELMPALIFLSLLEGELQKQQAHFVI